MQPNGNRLLTFKEEVIEATQLSYSICKNCFSLQQNNGFSDKTMYDDHPYLTQHNNQYLEELKFFVKFVLSKCSLKNEDLVMDIGCNDGSLLRLFRENGYQILGIDPSETAFKYSQAVGIPVLKNYWGTALSKIILREYPRPKLITSTASFYHMNDIKDWMQGIADCLDFDGFFAVQFVHSLEVIRGANLDQFYHEHTFLHCLNSVDKLASKHGMEIFDVIETPSQGGSLILLLRKKRNVTLCSNQVSLIKDIEKDFFDNLVLGSFQKSIDILSNQWRLVTNVLLRNNHKLIGLGASLRGISLINFLHIDPNVFEAILEINPVKIGRWTPRSRIPIIAENYEVSGVEYFVVLAWTQREKMLEKYSTLLSQGKSLIFPFPNFEVIGKDSLKLNQKLEEYLL